MGRKQQGMSAQLLLQVLDEPTQINNEGRRNEEKDGTKRETDR